MKKPKTIRKEHDFRADIEWYDVPQDVPEGRAVLDHTRIIGSIELDQWVGALVVQDFGQGPRAVGQVRWFLN